MSALFAKYDHDVELAEKALSKSLVAHIQALLKKAADCGDFYVCTGMGLCNLSADKFQVIYKDEPESGPHEDTDDFDLGEKLKDDGTGKYGVVVQCGPRARKALLEVHAICEELTDRDLQQVLPFKVFRDRIVK